MGGRGERRRENGKAFFGTGETFLFTFAAQKFEAYFWIGRRAKREIGHPPPTSMFMTADSKRLVVGGGGADAPGLELDSELKHGTSGHCATFDNPPLHGQDGPFICLALEAWTFVSE